MFTKDADKDCQLLFIIMISLGREGTKLAYKAPRQQTTLGGLLLSPNKDTVW